MEVRVKEYVGQTLGKVVKGALYDFDPLAKEEAFWQLVDGIPLSTVVIPDSIRTDVHFRIEEPHPDCKACHGEPQPVWYTSIIARAFPGVPEEHRAAVLRFGTDSNFVRVPIIEPLEVYYGDVCGTA